MIRLSGGSENDSKKGFKSRMETGPSGIVIALGKLTMEGSTKVDKLMGINLFILLENSVEIFITWSTLKIIMGY